MESTMLESVCVCVCGSKECQFVVYACVCVHTVSNSSILTICVRFTLFAAVVPKHLILDFVAKSLLSLSYRCTQHRKYPHLCGKTQPITT